jgi:hypothetical protein
MLMSSIGKKYKNAATPVSIDQGLNTIFQSNAVKWIFWGVVIIGVGYIIFKLKKN